ncbi:hypothetical protein AB0M43_02495 [Longispora sp. NPDC051575]|uniref:hypothetical protein n=1 Tax=Longispora sp. NPDC051575 TaxID=3154943 RepID=UPI0034378764
MRHITTDAQLDRLLPVDEAVRLLRHAFLAPGPTERLAAAALHHGSTPAGRFLAAGLSGDGPLARIVFDDLTGAVTGLVVGAGLGDLRAAATAVLGAEHLTAAHPHRLTVLGTGRRAFAQLRFLAARLRPTELLAHGPDADAFATRARQELGLAVVRARDPEEAVRGARLVVAAADGPALDPAWLSPGTHVSLSPVPRSGAAWIPALLARADRTVTDAPALARAHLRALGSAVEPEDLADLVAGRTPVGSRADAVTVLLSCGLPGGDVALAEGTLRRAAGPVGHTAPRRAHRRTNYRRRA